MMTKFATFEGAEILDLKGSSQRRTASLDKLADFENYRTEDGFLYARIRAISSRVNRNHDGWPSIELAGSQDIFDHHHASGAFTVEADTKAEYGFSTFLGKPIFVDHHNSNPDRARGVIVDTKLHVEDGKTSSMDPYYASDECDPSHKPPTWVELLLEVDAKAFPKLAKAIVEGAKDAKTGIDGFSMGCNVTHSKCSHCNNVAESPEEYCDHIIMKGAMHLNSKTGKVHKSYENCFGVQFFEISAVFDPADETALLREVKTAGMNPYVDPSKVPVAEIEALARQLMTNNPGMAPEEAMQYAQHELSQRFAIPSGVTPGEGYQTMAPKRWEYKTDLPPSFPSLGMGDMPRYQGAEGKTAAGQAGYVECPECAGDRGIQDCPYCAGNGHMLTLHAGGDGFAVENVPPPSPMPSAQRGQLPREPIRGSTGSYTLDRIARLAALPAAGGGNPEPQIDLLKMPSAVDTLRDQKVCPVCGDKDMEGEECKICGYIQEPEGFGNPDLTKAKQVQDSLAREQLQGDEDQPEQQPLDQGDAFAPGPQPPTNGLAPGGVTSAMRWHITHTSGKINTIEHPILQSTKPVTDEPQETVVSDQTRPVTSSVRTARDFIAAAGRNLTEKNMKTADAASGAPSVATPDKRVDADGVGGVMDASNESASKADAQVDVEGKGGTGVEGVAPDSTESVEQGSDTSKNIEAIPTKTWGNGSGVEHQTDPVTGEVYPADGGVKKSSDDAVYPSDDGGLAGGKPVQGVQPSDPVGKPDQRVNLFEHTTSPANNSGPTKTWSGTDGNGVLRQQEPITHETIEGSDIVNLHASSSSHMFNAMKLADLEVDLGLLSMTEKYARLSELERLSPIVLQAEFRMAHRVKTAGLSKSAPRVAKRMPVMGRSAAAEPQTAPLSDSSIGDSAVFM